MRSKPGITIPWYALATVAVIGGLVWVAIGLLLDVI